MFGAVNGTTISIYNTYSCENIGNLRGHNGKVGTMDRLREQSQGVHPGAVVSMVSWGSIEPLLLQAIEYCVVAKAPEPSIAALHTELIPANL